MKNACLVTSQVPGCVCVPGHVSRAWRSDRRQTVSPYSSLREEGPGETPGHCPWKNERCHLDSLSSWNTPQPCLVTLALLLFCR